MVADSGSEERGSRPIKGDHDKIWKIDVSNESLGKWYGWPDYALGVAWRDVHYKKDGGEYQEWRVVVTIRENMERKFPLLL